MAADLFAPGSPNVCSIPAGLDFLGVLAKGLAQATGLKDNPGALNDAIIYVPNRRSARVLAQKLFEASGARVLLAPDIRALGDLETEDDAPIAEIALNGLPEALSAAERTGALARLVQTYYRSALGREIPPLGALKAARNLARLLDQAALAGDVDWTQLPDLVASADLAEHWQSSVQFLDIIRHEWPAYLEAVRHMDAPVRRLAAARFLCEGWRAFAPASPVIIAGSTGATPAGRLIMQAALTLPKGLIVFPGLDRDASAHADAIRAAPSHPQHVMLNTLNALGVSAEDVADYPHTEDAPFGAARRRMIHAALAPAGEAAGWRETLDAMLPDGATRHGFAREALRSLSISEFAHEAAEAEAAALLLRDALEAPGKTAALVTPDAGLSRRVSALLKQWDIHVEPSSGTPLNRTEAGRFALLCARWMLDPSDPLALSAVTKHGFARDADQADACERFFLRGSRTWRDFNGLTAHILRQEPRPHRDAYTPETQADVCVWVEAIAAIIAAAQADLSNTDALTGAEFIDRLSALMIRFGPGTDVFSGEDGRALVKLFENFTNLTAPLGTLTPSALCELIESEASRAAVYSETASHPRLAIWGPLEARLQTADRLILAGLNEEVWPDRPSADPFLPRRFRAALGLKDMEEQTGLAAHDFAQLACAPEVYLLYARRRDDGPAIASRWIWRLRTLAQGALLEDAAAALAPDVPIERWLTALDRQGRDTLPDEFTAKPGPKSARPNWPEALSATRVELLVRDPYALWAEDVLMLAEDGLLDEPLAVTGRGSAIHKAIELFERMESGHTADALTALLRACLAEAGERDETFAARQAVTRRTAQWYLNWREARLNEGCDAPLLETRGALNLMIAGAPFRLSAVADRIDVFPDGRVRIADFKTGEPPTLKKIKSGFSWQMPLQALIARDGGFKGVANARVEGLEYVSFKARPMAVMIENEKTKSIDDFAIDVHRDLIDLITSIRSGEMSILSAPRVKFREYASAFDQLARRAEWGGETDEGEDAADA